MPQTHRPESTPQPLPEQHTTLPEGWEERFDKVSGCIYYCNGKVTQWEHPSSSLPSSADHEIPLPEGWERRFDESSGCVYYCNAEVSQWEHPSSSQRSQESQEKPSDNAAKPWVSSEATPLPPGWRAMWHAQENSYYYADMETRVTQWDPPPAYEHGDWARHIDCTGQAYWESRQLGLSFHENAAGEWERYP